IQLGTDEDGDPVFSRYVQAWASGQAPKPAEKPPGLGDRETIALSSLLEAVKVHGEVFGHESIPEGTQCVTLDCWREYAYRRGICDGSADAKQKAFKRACDKLNAKGKIGIYEPFVWPKAETARPI